jgi:predicted DNA-binding protein with PD1-like motif
VSERRWRIAHPGPVAAARWRAVPCGLRQARLELAAGTPLLAGLAEALAANGATSAVLQVGPMAFADFAYVMPAPSSTPEHAVYYSARHAPACPVQLHEGRITFGRRDGAPWLHCHARWRDAQGQEGSGHILPEEAVLEGPAGFDAVLLDGAGFVTAADPETNFSLFEPQAMPGADVAPGRGLVVRIRPNQDLCMALETLCAAQGWNEAVIRGGVGSLIGARFDDGRAVVPEITEVYVRHGSVARGADGRPVADVEVTMVDPTGAISSGRLARGDNPVLVTFELVLQPLH